MEVPAPEADDPGQPGSRNLQRLRTLVRQTRLCQHSQHSLIRAQLPRVHQLEEQSQDHHDNATYLSEEIAATNKSITALGVVGGIRDITLEEMARDLHEAQTTLLSLCAVVQELSLRAGLCVRTPEMTPNPAPRAGAGVPPYNPRTPWERTLCVRTKAREELRRLAELEVQHAEQQHDSEDNQ